MTPKGAAVLPRPFCYLFAFLSRAFCRHFYYFGAVVLPRPFCRLFSVFPPLSPFSCSPQPATFCQLSPAQAATFCKLLPAPARAKFTFCQLLATLCALAARFLSPSVPISAVFPFFCKCRVFSCKNRRPLPSFEKGQAKAFRSALSLPNIKS